MSPRRIEIVDGNSTAALVTQRGLQVFLSSEAEVAVASSPNAAWLRCLREEVDLVIIDPDPKNGEVTSLVQVLRAYRPMLPLVVLTAYDSPRLRTQMRSLGIEHYLAKPIDLTDLNQEVLIALRNSFPAHVEHHADDCSNALVKG